jgi:hypothetical protein
VSLAGALGPFGEWIIFALAALVAYLSRKQVAQMRTEVKVVKVEADAYKTAVLSMRPPGLHIPPLPLPTIKEVRPGSSLFPEEEDTKP